ncbi:hypothetical protein ACW5EG_02950 [Luteimonas sp. A611]
MKQPRISTAKLCCVLAAWLLLAQAWGGEPPHGDESRHHCQLAHADAQGTLPGEILPPASSSAERPGNTARIDLSTYLLDETEPDLRGESADADVRIYVDNQLVARADDAGRASFGVPAGEFELTALIPSTAIATVTVSIDPGQTRAIDLVLDDSKEVVSPATAVVDSMSGDLLPHDFHTFGIRLLDAGAHRPVRYISEIAIEDESGNLLLPLSNSFTVDANGNMQPVDIAALRVALLPYTGQRLVLKAQGEDSRGFTLTARKYLLIAGDGP